MSLRLILTLGLLTLLGGPTLAQYPHGSVQAPLLFVRFQGPPGMRTVFFPGRAPSRRFPAPVVVGMRPGYCYRVQLTDLPGRPLVSLYPSIEVRGVLNVTPKLRAVDFPAPIVLTEADIESALAGNLITKVIYLERPDSAEPTATRPGEVLEASLPPTFDLLKEARERGRVMLVVRLGARQEPEDLREGAIPNTLLFPGERTLMPAPVPPCLPVACWPFYDPKIGPRPPEEECFHDGGDRGPRAAFGRDGELYGLDSEDTVAEYTDSAGRRSIVCSTRCCLCAPRYLALRTEVPLALTESSLSLLAARKVVPQENIVQRLPPLLTAQTKVPLGVQGRLRPSINIAQKGPNLLVGLKVLSAHEVVIGPLEYVGTKQMAILTEVQKAQLLRQIKYALELSEIIRLSATEAVKGPVVVGSYKGLEVVVGTVETRELTLCCCEKPVLPDKPLVLVKCADRSTAQVGDIVTFTLKYSNLGGRPIADVAVSDSLAARLEYVPGSAETDRDAVLTMQENEVGSLILRWEVGGTLQPGQSGRIRFKARVR